METGEDTDAVQLTLSVDDVKKMSEDELVSLWAEFSSEKKKQVETAMWIGFADATHEQRVIGIVDTMDPEVVNAKELIPTTESADQRNRVNRMIRSTPEGEQAVGFGNS